MSELEEAEFTVHKIKELLAGGGQPADIVSGRAVSGEFSVARF